MTAPSSAASRLVSESLTYTGIDAAQNLIALAVVPASLYWLTPADMGAVTLALLVTQFVMTVGALGLDFAVIRYYLAWPADERAGRVGGALAIVTAWTIALMIAAVFVTRISGFPHAGIALAAVAAGTGLAVRAVPLAVFRVASGLRSYATVVIAGSALQALLQLGALMGGLSVTGFVASTSIATWISAAVAVHLLRHQGVGRPVWPDAPSSRLAGFNLASGLLNRVVSSADRLALLIWSTVDTLGVYGMAVRWSLPLRMLSGGTKLAVAPALSRAERDGSYSMHAPIAAYLLVLALLTAILQLLSSILLVTPWRVVVGEFQRLLSVLLLAQLFGCMTLIAQVVLYYIGRARWSTAMAMLSTLLTIGGVLWLVPRYGAMGAAIAQLFASGLTLVVVGVVSRRTRWFSAPAGRAVVAVVVLGALPWIFDPAATAVASLAAVVVLGLASWPVLREWITLRRVSAS